MEKTLQITSNNDGTNTEYVNIKLSQGIGDFMVQFDVLEQEQKQTRLQQPLSLDNFPEEIPSLQSLNGVNIYSPIDIVQTILRQINPRQESSFLTMLQHLLGIDAKESIRDLIWSTAEKLVHRATLIENQEDSESLLRSTIAHKLTCPKCSWSDDSSTASSTPPTSLDTTSMKMATLPTPPPSLPESTNIPTSTPSPLMPDGTPAPMAVPGPPPPPPPMPGAPPPPPPPAMPGCPPPPPPPAIPGGPPPPPPAPGAPMPPPPAPGAPHAPGMPRTAPNALLPHQLIPKPKTKMKTLNWCKIPPQKIHGKDNIWTLSNICYISIIKSMDFHALEELFCLPTVKKPSSDTVDAKAKSKKDSGKVHLIDGKRSLNINIFLKQFKGYDNNEGVIQLIRTGNHKVIGPERLKGLLKLLPEAEEIETLNGYDGEWQRLGSAEQFLILLLKVPNYKLLIECMLLKEEFAANMTYLEPSILAVIEAGNALMANRSILDILTIIMITGNFLNSGGYAGNAAGINLTTLTQLTDIRANKPGMNLLHFVAIQIEKSYPELINFPNDLSFLENVAKINLEQITVDIHDLDKQLQKISLQLQLPNIDAGIKDQMQEFLETAKSKIAQLKEAMDQVDVIRLKLADFFCEEAAKFHLDECFKIFYTFSDNFSKSLKDNEKRQQAERQTLLRQKQKEETMSRKPEKENPLKSSQNRRISIQISACNDDNPQNCSGDELLNYLESSLPNKSPRCKKSRISIAYQTCNDQNKENRERNSTSDIVNSNLSALQFDDDREIDLKLMKNLQNLTKDSIVKRRRSKHSTLGLHRPHSIQFDSELPTLPEGKCLTSEQTDNSLGGTTSRSSMFIRSTSFAESPKSTGLITDSSNFHIVDNVQSCNGSHDSKSVSCLQHSDSRLLVDPEHPEYFITNNVSDKSVSSQAKPLELTDSVKVNSAVTSKRPKLSLKTVARLTRFGRSYSSINENDLQEALKSLKTPTIVPDCIWDAHSARISAMHDKIFNFENVTPTTSDVTNESNEPHLNSVSYEKNELETEAKIDNSQNFVQHENPKKLSKCDWELPSPKKLAGKDEPQNTENFHPDDCYKGSLISLSSSVLTIVEQSEENFESITDFAWEFSQGNHEKDTMQEYSNGPLNLSPSVETIIPDPDQSTITSNGLFFTDCKSTKYHIDKDNDHTISDSSLQIMDPEKELFRKDIPWDKKEPDNSIDAVVNLKNFKLSATEGEAERTRTTEILSPNNNLFENITDQLDSILKGYDNLEHNEDKITTRKFSNSQELISETQNLPVQDVSRQINSKNLESENDDNAETPAVKRDIQNANISHEKDVSCGISQNTILMNNGIVENSRSIEESSDSNDLNNITSCENEKSDAEKQSLPHNKIKESIVVPADKLEQSGCVEKIEATPKDIFASKCSLKDISDKIQSIYREKNSNEENRIMDKKTIDSNNDVFEKEPQMETIALKKEIANKINNRNNSIETENHKNAIHKNDLTEASEHVLVKETKTSGSLRSRLFNIKPKTKYTKLKAQGILESPAKSKIIDNRTTDPNDDVFEAETPNETIEIKKETANKINNGARKNSIETKNHKNPIHNNDVIEASKDVPVKETKSSTSIRSKLFNMKPKIKNTESNTQGILESPTKSETKPPSTLKSFSKGLLKTLGMGKSSSSAIKSSVQNQNKQSTTVNTKATTATPISNSPNNQLLKKQQVISSPRTSNIRTTKTITPRQSIVSSTRSTTPRQSTVSSTRSTTPRQSTVSSTSRSTTPRQSPVSSTSSTTPRHSTVSSTSSIKTTNSSQRPSISKISSGKSAANACRSPLNSSCTSYNSPRVSINCNTLNATFVRSGIISTRSIVSATPAKKPTSIGSVGTVQNNKNKTSYLTETSKSITNRRASLVTANRRSSLITSNRRSSLVTARRSFSGVPSGKMDTNLRLCKKTATNASNTKKKTSSDIGESRRSSLITSSKRSISVPLGKTKTLANNATTKLAGASSKRISLTGLVNKKSSTTPKLKESKATTTNIRKSAADRKQVSTDCKSNQETNTTSHNQTLP